MTTAERNTLRHELLQRLPPDSRDYVMSLEVAMANGEVLRTGHKTIKSTFPARPSEPSVGAD